MNLEEIFYNIDILYTTNPEWKIQLFTKLRLIKTRGEEPYFDESVEVLSNILDMVKNLGCKSVIIEKDYMDQDFLEEYSEFYCKSFEVYSSKTQRLHFFEEHITYDDLKDLSTKQYLGYSVVRPINSYCTGKTVIKPPYDDGNTRFTYCKATFTTTLSGSNLKIQGTPFIQQDTNVNVCAQASMWMASYYLHQKYGCSRFYPPEITHLATRYMSVGPPRVGLNPIQIVTALRDMGYQVVKFSVNFSQYINEAILLISSYIKSELPAILVLKTLNGYHAICVIGYSYKVDFSMSSKNLFCPNNIEHFYYQDDASGPYRILYKDNPPPRNFSIKDNVELIIVPLPKQITLQGNDVYERVPSLLDINFLNNTINYFQKFFEEEEVLYFSQYELQDLVCYQSYLRKSSDFKLSLPEEMSYSLRLIYKAMLMPKYIWVIELTKKDLVGSSLSKNRKIIGEILIDSTADHNDTGTQSYLAIHLNGRMIVRKPPDILWLYHDLDEKPYSQLMLGAKKKSSRSSKFKNQ